MAKHRKLDSDIERLQWGRKAAAVERKAPAVERKAATVERKAAAVERKAAAVERKAAAVEWKAATVERKAAEQRQISPQRPRELPKVATSSMVGWRPFLVWAS